MTDEFQITMTCARTPYATMTASSREQAEACARLKAREWERRTGGPVEVQVQIHRRQVTPWIEDGEVYEFSTTDLDRADAPTVK
jgi:hypothetical protein